MIYLFLTLILLMLFCAIGTIGILNNTLKGFSEVLEDFNNRDCEMYSRIYDTEFLNKEYLEGESCVDR